MRKNNIWVLVPTIVLIAISWGGATWRAQFLSAASLLNYVLVDTNQTKCYNTGVEIAAPTSSQSFYGQDAQYSGRQPSYTISADGLTVFDNNTGLTWQRSPDTNGDGSITAGDKLTLTQAQARPATLNAARWGDYGDWRLPSIKELYSLIDFRGTDPSVAGNNTAGLVPFIDTKCFKFAYGDTSAGERIIDSQYASSTLYVSTVAESKLFGVNFADGRIKGYGLKMKGFEKTFLVQCVRGNTSYGVNNFVRNADGTVTDNATGLMWSQTDSGKGMNWQEALSWATAMNSQNYLGYHDWRLPNAKELQSIVDYTRSPDTTSSAAISDVFACTQITNEAGQPDYPCYWTGTTHASFMGGGTAAVYVAFGRAMGYMGGWVDVHGAGAQRSDPKSGNPADFPYGRGPQGDAIRIYNYIRLVRDAPENTITPHALLKEQKKVPALVSIFAGTVPEEFAECHGPHFLQDFVARRRRRVWIQDARRRAPQAYLTVC